MNRIYFLLALITRSLMLLAQEPSKSEIDSEQLTDNLFALPDADTNYEDQYENLLQLMAHPLDLNMAGKADLQNLKILTDQQVNDFIQYRDSLGSLLSVYELQAIPHFDRAVIEKLLPFVRIQDTEQNLDRSILRRIQNQSSNYFLLRYERQLEQKSGYTMNDADKRFRGTPDKLYCRYRTFRAGDFSIGFTIEKDAGEAWQWKPSQKYYGVDYISWHIQLQNKGRLKNFILGDFQSQFAQGLVLGGLFGIGKGGETVLSTRKSNIGFVPYTSAYETGSLRGLAITYKAFKHLYVSGFLSSHHRDASIMQNDNHETIVTSRISTGFHRNANELATRRNLKEEGCGLILQYQQRQIDAGLTFSSTLFDKTTQLNETVYNQQYFEGKSNTIWGAYVNYTLPQASVFSEAAHNINGGYGVLLGTLASLSKKLDLSIVFRKYSPGFTTFYSNAMAENSSPRNETGIYWGWKFTITRKVNTSGYVDVFTFPWLRYRSYRPSYGNEWLLRLTYQPAKKIMYFLQIRTEQKERNVYVEKSSTYQTEPGRKINYWAATHFDASPMVRIKTRVQWSNYSIGKSKTSGIALLQDLQFRLRKLEITTRYALFDTDDYDNRQYAYENDVWLAYSLPAYNGTGTRKYVQLEYKFNKTVSCWIRYGQFQYYKQDSVSTGVEQVNGNTKSDVKCQLRIQF